jgi:hypothetical protein
LIRSQRSSGMSLNSRSTISRKHTRTVYTNSRQVLTARSKKDLELLLRPDFLAAKTHVAVIVDADDDAQAAVESFAGLLRTRTGQNTVVGGWTDSQPRIGLWVAPDGKNRGEIETLVWQAWSSDPANAGPKACIESFVDCMGRSNHRPKSPHKGLVNSLLAIQNDEDPRLGPGARANIFDFLRPEFVPLLEFLKGFSS